MNKIFSWASIKSEDAKALQAYRLFLCGCCNAMKDVYNLCDLTVQGLCRKGLGWGDSVPASAAQEWTSWVKEMQALNSFTIRRCLKPPSFGKMAAAQLHHFADASEEGYGTVTYLLLHSHQGMVQCWRLQTQNQCYHWCHHLLIQLYMLCLVSLSLRLHMASLCVSLL